MQERAPTAFFFSALLHGTVVAAILALAFVVQHQSRPPMQVFELVAGPPTDLTATEAPALGRREGTVEVKVNPAPARYEPPAAEPAAPTPPAPARPAAVAPAAAPKGDVKTTVHAPSRADLKRMTYEQYVKRYGPPSKARSSTAAGAGRARPAPKIDVRGIAEGVLGGSSRSKGGGGGHALTAAQRSELEGYIARLVTALRQNHEKPPGLSDLLAADVEFDIAPDGTISHIHVARSSGNQAFDRSCIDAFRLVGSVGPKPDGKADTWVLTFRMKDE